MTDKAEPAPDAGLYGTLASWGGGAWNYAASTINSLVGFDELDVVNPEGKEVESGKEVEADEKRQLEFGNYKDYVGMDITSLVTLPVWIMEPYTMLQKVAEIMEYTDLLDRAATTTDEYERMAWVAAYCLGPFGGNERTWKPFNPILGETFEVDKDNGVRFLAEQVSHHPPVGVAHAENEHWLYDIVSAPTTKFLGNSVDIYPVGRTRIKLRKTGEVYSLVPPNSKAHNVIVGGTWVDCYGDFKLNNVTTGTQCSLYFTPCGWFGAGRYEVSGHIFSSDGTKKLVLAGKWNSHLDMQKCDEEGDPLPGSEPVRMWTCKEKPVGDKYGFGYFSRLMNSGKGVNPLLSDSRRRPDRFALENGDHGMSGSEKYALEEMQRMEKRERQRRNTDWTPRWFKPAKDTTVYQYEATLKECPMWEFTGDYYKQPREPASPEDDVGGKDFSPWQFPEIHDKS
jgi:hypothetical protein